MDKLTPSSADITLIFTCPKCDTVHIASREETIFPAGALCCCGTKLQFKPINKIKLSFVYGGKKKSPKSTSRRKSKVKTRVVSTDPMNEEVVNEVTSGLVSLGYKKSEASKVAKTWSEKYPLATSEEIITAILKQIARKPQ